MTKRKACFLTAYAMLLGAALTNSGYGVYLGEYYNSDATFDYIAILVAVVSVLYPLSLVLPKFQSYGTDPTDPHPGHTMD